MYVLENAGKSLQGKEGSHSRNTIIFILSDNIAISAPKVISSFHETWHLVTSPFSVTSQHFYMHDVRDI
jgi:hypothetical protein